ncbi:MAG: histidine phosphatase family protein [Promethearchaeota archaeon]
MLQLPNKKYNLFFVRHGEADYNVEGKFLGISNRPLTQKGIEQVQKSARKLIKLLQPNEKFDVILTSPLLRAKQTAQIIAQIISNPKLSNKYLNKSKKIPIIEEELLKERNYGLFEGKTVSEIQQMFPNEFQKYKKDKANTKPPNGELAVVVENRIKELLFEKIPKKYSQYKNIILTTHLNPIRVALIILELAKKDIYYYKFKNASIIQIEFNPANPSQSRIINFNL